jgi:protein ImuB
MMFCGVRSPHPVPAHALLELAHAFSPRAEGGGDWVLLDLSGLQRLWPEPHAFASAFAENADTHGLRPLTIVVARSRMCAFLLARGAIGVHVVDAGDEARALAPLPVGLLDLPAEVSPTFAQWGIRTLGQLAALPVAGLVSRFGPAAMRWQQRARGVDEEPLQPTPAPEHFEMALELDWPIDGLEPLSFVIGPMLEQLASRLSSRGRQAVSLAIALTLVDRRTVTRALRTAVPTLSPRTWRTLLLLELEKRPPPDAIQKITLCALPTAARQMQLSLLHVAQPSPERLSETLARLSSWVDSGRAGSPSLLPTHRPDAFVMTPFDAFVTAESTAPPRLAIVLRAYRPPREVEVRVQGGIPVALRGEGLRGEIRAVAGPWRASGDWWGAAFCREEWDVEMAEGIYRIFRDVARKAWFLEGELD